LSGKQRQFVEGQKYTLLSRRRNLTSSGRASLKILLNANKRLNTAYVLKESFGQLWDYRTERGARRFFDNWRDALKWQRIKPYEKFAAMIERHWSGVAAYCRPENKVALGFVEGLNTKIRVLQRRAFGLRDEQYLRLAHLRQCPKGTQGLCPRTPGVLRWDAAGRLGRLTSGRAEHEDVAVGWKIGLRRSATRAPADCHTARHRAELLRPVQPHPVCRRHPSVKLRGGGQSLTTPPFRYSLPGCVAAATHERDKNYPLSIRRRRCMR
jgi:hypothetical protein